MVQVAEGIPASSGGVPIPVEDYAHDSKGNRVSRTAKSGGAVETYAYDSQNRLVGYANPTTTATYAYDALDRRVAKTVDGAVTSYVYDTSMEDPLAFDDITLEFTDSILTRRWVHSDAVDEPVGFEAYTLSSGVGSGTEHTMFADRQGSVIWVTEPTTGQLVAGYEYDGYGKITQTQGTLSQPYGYTGREYDAESGFYHYRARAYDPAAGVFVQVDPIEFDSGTTNLMGYVDSNTFNAIDPTGWTASISYRKYSADASANGISSFTPAMEATIGYAGFLSRVIYTIQAGYTGIHMPAAPIKGGYNCDQRLLAALQKIKPTSLPSCKGTFKDYQNLARMSKISTAILVRRGISELCYGGTDNGTHGSGPTGQLSQLYAQLEDCRRKILRGTQGTSRKASTGKGG